MCRRRTSAIRPGSAARRVVARRGRGLLGLRRDVDRLLLGRDLLLLGGCLVLVAEALLEALQALRHIAHHRREAVASEQQQDEDRDDQDMPEAETAHEETPV